MTPISDLEWVALAARCDAGPPVEAALAALALAWPEVPAARWPALDAGRRDALLLQWRRSTLGDRLPAECRCPACGERLEFDLQASTLAGSAAAELPHPHDELPPLSLVRQGELLALRRPGTRDLQQAESPAALMLRCLVPPPPTAAGTPLHDEAARAACNDPAWQQAFGEALAADHPCTDPQVGLCCPACGHAWEETFDIAHFIADDLRATASRLLDEVHLMALAYHWSEREILSLPASRRRHYLRRLGA